MDHGFAAIYVLYPTNEQAANRFIQEQAFAKAHDLALYPEIAAFSFFSSPRPGLLLLKLQ